MKSGTRHELTPYSELFYICVLCGRLVWHEHVDTTKMRCRGVEKNSTCEQHRAIVQMTRSIHE